MSINPINQNSLLSIQLRTIKLEQKIYLLSKHPKFIKLSGSPHKKKIAKKLKLSVSGIYPYFDRIKQNEQNNTYISKDILEQFKAYLHNDTIGVSLYHTTIGVINPYTLIGYNYFKSFGRSYFMGCVVGSKILIHKIDEVDYVKLLS